MENPREHLMEDAMDAGLYRGINEEMLGETQGLPPPANKPSVAMNIVSLRYLRRCRG